MSPSPFQHGRRDRFQPCPDGHLPYLKHGDLGKRLGDFMHLNLIDFQGKIKIPLFSIKLDISLFLRLLSGLILEDRRG
jgi:hypothetical protein